MDRVSVRLPVTGPDRSYDILIERGLLHIAGEHIRSACRADKLLLVTDGTVQPLYGETIRKALEASGFTVTLCVLPAGERSKSLSVLERIYDAGMDAGLTRKDALVALGGGVVGDVAGFAAATLLRGMDYIQIPTTLLAQVDSSVGGKVAVNLKSGKNLAGAFHQPRLVLIDPDCLESLPDRVFADGMAEVIKYGAILSLPLFEQLEISGSREALRPHLSSVIAQCCDLKRSLVVEDERDTGQRMLLNFGHTLGHAYEAAYQYEKYTHGEAVAAGMCLVAALGEHLGLTQPGTQARLTQLIRHFMLPTHIDCPESAYRSAMNLDKKGLGDRIHLIVLSQLGNAMVHPLPREEVLNLIRIVDVSSSRSLS